MEKQLEEREGDEKKAGQRKVSREHQPKKKQGRNVLLFGPLTLNCYNVILQLNDFSPNCYSTESAGSSWLSRSIR